MKHLFSAREREYIYDHGWQINCDGMLILTAKQAAKAAGKSIRHPGKRTLMLPDDTGLVLLIEGLHFIVNN